MRLLSMVGRATGLLFCAYAGSALSQVVEITGGASSAYAAQGGTMVVHGEHFEMSLGAGLVNGRFGLGGMAARRALGGTMTVGQQAFSLELPTDIFNTGHVFFGSGWGLRRAWGERRTLSAFVGSASQDAGSPLFRTAGLGSISSFGQWRQPVGKHCFSVSTMLFSTANGLLESVQCSRLQQVTFSATAGSGGGAPYGAASLAMKSRRLDLRASYIGAGSPFTRGNNSQQFTPEPVRENISVEYRPSRILTLSGLRQNFQLPSFGSGTNASWLLLGGQSTLEEGSVSLHGRTTGASVNLLHSTAGQQGSRSGIDNTALSANFYRSYRRLQWSENLLADLAPEEKNSTTLINGVSIDVSSRLRLTESANISANGPTFSHGGTLLTSFSSFEVDYQLFYLADRPSRPFQQSMIVDAKLHLLRSLYLHVSSMVGPTGAPLYTAQLGSLFARASQASLPISPGALGENVLRGRVTDPTGVPVSGAALMIGMQRVYTDSDGYFSYREKSSRTHAFRVLTDEFLTDGDFVAVDVPNEVRTEAEREMRPLRIVVMRRPLPEVSAAKPSRSGLETP